MALRQRGVVAKLSPAIGARPVVEGPKVEGPKVEGPKVLPSPHAASQLKGTRQHSAVVLVVLLFGAVIGGLAFHAMQRVPSPLSPDAPAHMFSEGRAMRHVEVLAGDIGIRTVGSGNHLAAAAYILEELEKIASLAGDHLRVEIDEQHVSGGFRMSMLTHNMAMEYENITNVVLRISAGDSSLDGKAVLMNAHYDSTAGTPGASDCAQCVGVALEVARLFASSREAPSAPLIFLFNGAEETFMMGAHGFLKAHRWRDMIGAVVNIESTGPGGPDIVFQAAGADLWPVRVYAEVAPHPRATVIGQDTFDAHVIPGDTDFRIFAQDFGQIPGLDVVSLLDAYAYHTTQDTPDRIRIGTVQAMGENLYALMKGISKAPELNASTTDTYTQRAVFWDYLGYVQVYYPRANALIFHLTPLAILLIIPLFTSDHASGLRGMLRRYNGIVAGVLLSALSMVLALASAVGVAIFRVAISGKPMSWLASPSLAVLMYAPPALLAIVMVQTMRSRGADVKNSTKQRALDFTGHWGSAVGFNAVMSAVLILRGIGTSYLFMFWAMVLLPGLQLASEAGGFQSLAGLVVYLTIASVPLAQTFYLAFMMGTFVAQKVGASGNWPDPIGSYIGDVVLAAMVGLQVALLVGPLAPILRRWLAHRRTLRFLLLLTLLGPLLGSTAFPYSPTVLKRLAVQHTIWTQGKKDVLGREFSLLSFDPLAPTFIFDHSLELRDHFKVAELGRDAYQRPLPNTWLALFPLSEMVHRDISLPDPLLEPPSAVLKRPFPRLKVISNEQLENDRRRILVEINNGALGHAWRTVNVTGPVVGWSLGGFQLPAPEQRPGGPPMYIARHAGGPGTDKWRFWIEAEGSKKVRIDLAVLKSDPTPELETIHRLLPHWVDYIGLTTYMSTWKV